MAIHEVEYVKFIKVRFEAENQEEANGIAAIMEEGDIEQGQLDGYYIWNEPREIT